MPENLYQQNLDIIKGFFRKPIVLITAIVMFVTIAANYVLDIFISNSEDIKRLTNYLLTTYGAQYFVDTSDNRISVSIPVVSILFAIAFLLFYIFSRKPERGLNGPATLLKIVAIIELVIICLVAAFCALLILLFCWIAVLAPDSLPFVLVIFVVFGCLIAALLIEAISFVMFSSSIKKSINGIYLYRKGAKTYAVMQFIMVGIYVLFVGVLCFMSLAFESQPLFYTSGLSYYIYFLVIEIAVNIPSTLCMGILALQYDSYIKELSQNVAPPIQQAPIYQEPAPTTSPYDPQHIAEYEPQPQAVFCSNCGKQLNLDDYFCNQCGTPVQR